jgi:PAS domain S-box-containing protein
MENVQMIWTLIEGTNDLVHSVRRDGHFDFVNRAWLNTLEYSDEDVLDLTVENVVFPGLLKEYQASASRVFAGESLTNIETTFVSKSGTLILAEGNLFPRYEEGKVVALQGFYRNVTDRKKSEEELREQRARTEFFVDLMTHDLTNINQEVLSTFEILLHDSTLSGPMINLLKEGLREVERSSNLIANVKKISQLYTETPAAKKMDPAKAIFSAAKAVESSFPDKTLKLNTNFLLGQYLVLADDYLRDVFQSLLHNAMKFDERREVEVDVEINVVRHTPFLRIQIKDNGRGIPDEEKEEIFARIAHRRGGILGLGLGLTLVKQILENYGGQIMVKDRVDGNRKKGANFTVLLRYEQPSKADSSTDDRGN